MRIEKRTVECESLDATLRIGRQLGAVLARGHVVAFIGPLGSGKTTLVKAIAAGAGVGDPRVVNSPTFVIVNEYEGRGDAEGDGAERAVFQTAAKQLPASEDLRRIRDGAGLLRIFHLDAYRLRNGEDLAALGFDEMCAAGAVLIEWADRVSDVLPAERLTIVLEPVGETHRRLECTAVGESGRVMLEAIGGMR